MVDEANIETHGFVENGAISLLACDQAVPVSGNSETCSRSRDLFE